jgi:hypothetical protein
LKGAANRECGFDRGEKRRRHDFEPAVFQMDPVVAHQTTTLHRWFEIDEMDIQPSCGNPANLGIERRYC